MPIEHKISVPQFVAKFENVEFLPLTLTDFSKIESGIKVNPDYLSYVSQKLNESNKNFGLNIETRNNTKGETFYRTALKETGDMLVPKVKCTFDFLLMTFAMKVLSSDTEGVRVIDKLFSSQTMLLAGKMVNVPTLSCYEPEANVPMMMQSLKPLYDECERYLNTSSMLIDDNVNLTIGKFLNFFLKLSKIKIVEEITCKEALLLSYLSSIIASLYMLFDGKSSTQTLKYFNVFNLPVQLNPDNSVKTLCSLYEQQLYSDFSLDSLVNEKISLKDIFEFKNGSIVFANDFLQKFSEISCLTILTKMIDLTSKLSDFELKITRLKDYLVDEISLAALTSSSLPPMARYLSGLFYSYDMKDSQVISSLKDINTLQHDVIIQREQLNATLVIVQNIIDDFYHEQAYKDLKGFSFEHDLVNGRDLIFRIRMTRRQSDSLVFENCVILDGKRPQITRLRSVQIQPNQQSWINDRLVNNTYPDYEKIGSGHLSSGDVVTDEYQSRYGVALEGVDKKKVVSILNNCSLFISLTIDALQNKVSGFVRSGLFTILPPSSGVDYKSFGKSQRREALGSDFIIKKIDANNSDIIDLLFSYPSRFVVGAESQELKKFYLARFEDLTEQCDMERLAKRVPISEIKYNTATMDYLLKASLGNLNSFSLMNHGVTFLPSGCKDYRTKILPCYDLIQESYDYILRLPFELLNANSQYYSRIANGVVVEGPVCSDGKPQFVASKFVNDKRSLFKLDDSVVESLKKVEDLNPTIGINSFYLVIHICTKDSLSFYSTDIIERKDKSFYGKLYYDDPAINVMVKDPTFISTRGSCFGLQSEIFRHDYCRSYQHDNPITTAFHFLTDLCYSLLSLRFSLYGFNEEQGKETEIVKNELLVLRDYLSLYYNDNLLLSCLWNRSNGTVKDFISAVDKFVKDSSNNNLIVLINTLSHQNLVHLMTTYLAPPIEIDSLAAGLVSTILTGSLEFCEAPKSIQSVNIPSLGYLLNEDASKIILLVLQRNINATADRVSFN